MDLAIANRNPSLSAMKCKQEHNDLKFFYKEFCCEFFISIVFPQYPCTTFEKCWNTTCKLLCLPIILLQYICPKASLLTWGHNIIDRSLPSSVRSPHEELSLMKLFDLREPSEQRMTSHKWFLSLCSVKKNSPRITFSINILHWCSWPKQAVGSDIFLLLLQTTLVLGAVGPRWCDLGC